MSLHVNPPTIARSIAKTARNPNNLPHQHLRPIYTASAPTRCAACPSSLLSSGLSGSGCLNTLRAAACCKSAIHVFHLSICACPSYACNKACVVLLCVLLFSPLQIGNAPLGFETKCCAPAGRCSTAQDRDKGTAYTQNEKMLQYTPITKYTGCIAGVGPLNNINERGPHYTTINIQASVSYNNPNQHYAPKTLATCCDSQRSIGHSLQYIRYMHKWLKKFLPQFDSFYPFISL